MSQHLVRKIEGLGRSLRALSINVAHNVETAIEALFSRDEEAARRVIDDDVRIDRLEIDLEEECLMTLALEQPVAADLRFVIAVLKINNDLERIGDLAVSMAEEAVSLARRGAWADPPIDLRAITRQVRWMLSESLEALLCRDDDLAEQVRVADDEVEGAIRAALDRLREWLIERPDIVPQGLSILRIVRDLERIAAHAVNIAEDVLYMTRGEIQRHNRPPLLQ